jgi:hypothetical protein
MSAEPFPMLLRLSSKRLTRWSCRAWSSPGHYVTNDDIRQAEVNVPVKACFRVRVTGSYSAPAAGTAPADAW